MTPLSGLDERQYTGFCAQVCDILKLPPGRSHLAFADDPVTIARNHRGAHSITGAGPKICWSSRDRQLAENVSTTIGTFTRGASENVFTKAVLEASREHASINFLRNDSTSVAPSTRKPSALLRALAARIRPDVIQSHAVKSHFLTTNGRAAGGSALDRVSSRIYLADAQSQGLQPVLDRWSTEVGEQGAYGQRSAIPRGTRPLSASSGSELRSSTMPLPRIGVPSARNSRNAAQLRAMMGIAPDRKVVLIVGRLSLEKDHLTLLDAINMLRSTLTPHLVIVGDGPERPRIEERIRRLGLTEYVTFTGQQNSAEPWYGIADLAVLSSLSEGSPNALLEAMATGVPVVATAVGGVPEIVTHEESALLISPGDPKAMSDAMVRLLTQPEVAERLTKRSHQLILERYQPDARMRKLVSIYRAVAASALPSQSS